MRTAIIGVFLLLISSCLLHAQDYIKAGALDKRSGKLYEAARGHINAGRNTAALADLDKLIQRTPNFIDGRLMYADLLLRQGDRQGAIAAFEAAIDLAPDYAPLAYFLLGRALFEEQQYPEAELRLQQYLDTGKASERYLAEAEQMLRSAAFAAQAVQSPVPFEPKPLGPAINTEQPEYLPSMTADGRYLAYTTRVTPGNEDIYFSEWKDGAWQSGRPLEALNTPYNDSSPSISADGSTMVFARNDRSGNFDLYYARWEGSGWSEPERLPEPISTAAFESQPALSADGQLLLFVSDRKGGQGLLDLWATRRNADGSWQAPQNLGDTINTPYNEQGPFLHPDGQTLYFMSKGHPGMGQYDLFRSQLQPDGQWGEPFNLGYPINTASNEGALIVSLDGKTAYFDSDKYGPTHRDQEMGNADLFQFELYPEARPQPATYVEAMVRDDKTKRPLRAQTEFLRLSTAQIHLSDETDERGRFLAVLPMGEDYALNVSKQGYFFHSENFALSEAGDFDEPYRLEIYLKPIPVQQAGQDTLAASGPVVLRNVFFSTGSAELREASAGELNRLKRLLEENPELRIRINGHTDDVGSEADNLALSTARARAVHDYLIDQGIEPERLQYKGFGESQPVAGNDTPEGRALNRRTEFETY